MAVKSAIKVSSIGKVLSNIILSPYDNSINSVDLCESFHADSCLTWRDVDGIER